MSLPCRGYLLLLISFFSYSWLQAQTFHYSGQTDTSSTKSNKTSQAQYQRGISGRWHTRLGISALADREYYSFPFAYELPFKINLRGIELQPAIA